MNDQTADAGADSMINDEGILALAARHGLELVEVLDVNELGLDFRVATASDKGGVRWVLRMPRRPDVLQKIEYEARALRFLAPRLPVAVPDWRVVAPDLVAYPRLNDRTAMAIDGATYTATWQIDPASPRFTESLASALVALHAIPAIEAVAAGFRKSDPEQGRKAFARDLDHIKTEFSVAESLERRWRTWLDDDTSWPTFTAVVHGDLYVGHILVGDNDQVSGMIDWTEAEVGDPSIDLSGHAVAFGQAGVEQLVTAYQRAGGQTWSAMVRHTMERTAASPIKYAIFALESGDTHHLDAVRTQLSAG